MKYQFTRFSSHSDPLTLDQDGRKVRNTIPEPTFWASLKCVLTLRHFGAGVRQGDDGKWYCKRCNRVSIP